MSYIQLPSSPNLGDAPTEPEAGSISAACSDLYQGLLRWRVSTWLGWSDAILPMRTTIVGPFWVTLQSALWVIIITALLGPNLGANEPLYPVYVAAGVTVFQLLTNLMVDGAAAFTRNAPLIQNIPNPFSLYILRSVFKSIYLFIAQIPVIIGATFFVPDAISWTWVLALPGLILIIFSMTGFSYILACITPFYRDIPFALSAIMRVMLFATPIFWLVESRTGIRAIAAQYNPFAHMIALVREPLMGAYPPALSIWLILAGGLLSWAIGLYIFSKTRLIIASNL